MWDGLPIRSIFHACNTKEANMLLYGIILDGGNLNISAHVSIGIGNMICSKHLLRSSAVANLKWFSKKTFFPLHVRTVFWVAI